VNVIAKPGSERNVLPEILKAWFGEAAGAPGTLQQVLFARNGEGYRLSKHEVEKDPVESLALWRRYTRDEAARAMGFEFRGMESQAGVFVRPGAIVLFVTLEKATLPDAHKYEDKFLSISEFQWQSQNRTTRESALGRDLREHKARGIEVRLFVRAKQKIAGKTQPFVYCGVLDFKDWDGDKPITVWWHLRSSVPGDLKSEFKIAG
jgi:hypothetical protein